MGTTKRNPSVQLALNGTPIYLHNIMISVSVKREEKDMSGQKSSTKKSDKGVKAKELNVLGFIPYSRKEWLTQLFNLAESEDGKGEQSKYRVSCNAAEAVNMREVQFSGEVSATEQSGQLGWSVSFTLREVNSVAEKKDQRKKKPKAKTQGEKAPVAKSAVENQGKSSEVKEKTSGTEKDTSLSGRINQGDWGGAWEAAKKGDWSRHNENN
ncbi:hypothetical protein [Rodentibacter pneumotropicus]|uniref:baseplate complex protein n=1 Tax=Rodentibacter pneumotropicus TaxID=758 RepID=UPI00109C368F|nr:hypothetical protein [Rodentibacter pneumotropicus]THA15669.1 hypothetical protein D3M82_05115 [Rodentibacter pneumotropicus]